MPSAPLDIDLVDEDATTRFGRALANSVEPGDTLLLDGPVGSGKTHLARALIQTLLPTPEDVPSPTFTLVQEYDTTKGPLWHADLYRLSDTNEIEELGLNDAFDTAICLVEWPDRLAHQPETALLLRFDALPQGRHVTMTWSAGTWDTRLELGQIYA